MRTSSTRKKKAEAKVEPPRKCTIVLPAEMDLALSLYAKKKGVDRSTVVVESLAKTLKGIRVSFPAE